jgi:hypothetical protein
MIGQEMGFYVGAKPYDFTAEDGKRLVGASVCLGHKPSSSDKGLLGLRYDIYSVAPEALPALDELKPFNEYNFGIEMRPGWKKAKIVSVSAK